MRVLFFSHVADDEGHGFCRRHPVPQWLPWRGMLGPAGLPDRTFPPADAAYLTAAAGCSSRRPRRPPCCTRRRGRTCDCLLLRGAVTGLRVARRGERARADWEAGAEAARWTSPARPRPLRTPTHPSALPSHPSISPSRHPGHTLRIGMTTQVRHRT